MEHKPASESPGLRSIEIMTQETRSTDRELFLDLRIEVSAPVDVQSMSTSK